jgi:hypothetical protein
MPFGTFNIRGTGSRCQQPFFRLLENDGSPILSVRVKGLAPPQQSRLIDPVIEAVSASA